MPLIARWPGTVKAGSESDHVSAFWDFLPTAAELAGAKAPENVDGISIAPTLLGKSKEQKKHQFLYWEFHERGGKQAVRMGKFKAVRLNVHKKPDGPLELYNLEDDLGEQNNIAAHYPKAIAKIQAYLSTARTDSATWPLKRKGSKT
jgi:arylsulfatase A-like enzyme